MTEDDAKAWLAARYDRSTIAHLQHFVTLLEAASIEQSLIARSTWTTVWSRHIVDSVQLLPLAPAEGPWLDIGSGGGLPGIVIAILRDAPVVLSEPRRKRAAFLQDAVAALGLRNASVAVEKAQNLDGRTKFAVVSARAVASMEDILSWSQHVVSRETLFLMPRGQNHVSELEMAKKAWHGRFHVEHSLTVSASGIVVAQDVARR